MAHQAVDLALLTEGEREELGGIERAGADRHDRRQRVWWWVLNVAVFVCWTWLTHVGSARSQDYQAWHAPAFGLAIAVMAAFFSYLTADAIAAAVTDREVERDKRAVLARIGYAERVREDAAARAREQAAQEDTRRRAALAGGGGSGGKSTRQLNHEWYGDHSELNWRDRELGQLLGMDADTYVNNLRDSD